VEPIRGLSSTLGSAAQMALLVELKSGPQTVSDLHAGTKQDQVAVSQRLRILRERGLVDFTVDGRYRWYKLTPDGRKFLRGAAAMTPGT